MTLHGIRIISLESRRSSEMAQLLEKKGATVFQAPSLREVPLSSQQQALAFGESLIAGTVDVLVLLTGVGTRMLINTLSTRWPEAQVLEAFARATIVARGPKPIAALKEFKLQANVRVPEPNTWRDLLATLDQALPVQGKHVAVQEYGRSNPELIEGLKKRGANVQQVPIYAWQLPEDIRPLQQAVRDICAGKTDVLLVTSARQVDHLFEIAEQLQLEKSLKLALQTKVAIASIGPVTTEGLQEYQIQADIHPEHPKMGHLALAIAAKTSEVLAQKRATLL